MSWNGKVRLSVSPALSGDVPNPDSSRYCAAIEERAAEDAEKPEAAEQEPLAVARWMKSPRPHHRRKDGRRSRERQRWMNFDRR